MAYVYGFCVMMMCSVMDLGMFSEQHAEKSPILGFFLLCLLTFLFYFLKKME